MGSCSPYIQNLMNPNCTVVFCLPQLKATPCLSSKEDLMPRLALGTCVATVGCYCHLLMPKQPTSAAAPQRRAPSLSPAPAPSLYKRVPPAPTDDRTCFWLDWSPSRRAPCVWRGMTWRYRVRSRGGAAVVGSRRAAAAGDGGTRRHTRLLFPTRRVGSIDTKHF